MLVDEAGQMTLPSALPPLLRAETFVLVGDPKQLPPLVRSPRADEEGLGVSPLALLSAAHPSAVITLSKQYRMNDDLAKIPNVITYEGALRAANDDVARRVASLPLPPPPGMPGWLLRATDPECRVVMLDTTDLGADAHEREGGGKPTNAFERAELENPFVRASNSTRGAISNSRGSHARRDARSRQLRFFGVFFLQHSDAPRKSRAPLDARAETRTALFELWR